MASKDLDKLMGKLKKKEIVEEKEVKDDDLEDDDLEDDDNDDTDEDADKKDNNATPKHDTLIENEVAILQNNGVFRRELLLVLRELVDVQKVQTQTLLDIKKKLLE